MPSGQVGDHLRADVNITFGDQKFGENMKSLAEQVSQKAINYHQFVRDRQIAASIRKH